MLLVLFLTAVAAFNDVVKTPEIFLNNPSEEANYAYQLYTTAMNTISKLHGEEPPQRRIVAEAVTSEIAMQAGMKAAELVVSYIGEMTKMVLESIRQAKEEVDKWENQLVDFTQNQINPQKIVEFNVDVKQATVLLNNADTEARNIMIGTYDMTILTIDELEFNMEDDQALAEAVVTAQLIYAVSLEESAERLQVLRGQVNTVRLRLASIEGQAETFSRTIDNNLNNKDGWMDAKHGEIRALAYGGCAACAVSLLLGPQAVAAICGTCYAIAIPVIENKVKELRADLEATKAGLATVGSMFKGIAAQTADLNERARESHDMMADVGAKLESTANRIVRFDNLRFWRRSRTGADGVIMRDLKALKVSLAKEIEKADIRRKSL